MMETIISVKIVTTTSKTEAIPGNRSWLDRTVQNAWLFLTNFIVPGDGGRGMILFAERKRVAEIPFKPLQL